MQKNRILFYDNHYPNRRDALRILSATGSEVLAPSNLQQLEQDVKSRRFTIQILDIEGHRHLIKNNLCLKDIPTVILAQEGMQTIYPYLNKLESFSNFIAKDQNNRISSRDILSTVVKILHSNIFGMKKYLSWGAHSQTFHARDSGTRQEYIECIKDYCRNMGLRRSIINNVEVVAEEFLMNAIYDAPIDKALNRLYANSPRTQRVLLSPEHAARLEFGSDGKRLAISVTDPFGSITRQKVLEYLMKCFEKKSLETLQDKGGAGIGLYFCFHHLDSLIINVDPMNKTEFIGLIDIDNSAKDSKHRNSNFHFFNTNNRSREFLLGDEVDRLDEFDTPSKKNKSA